MNNLIALSTLYKLGNRPGSRWYIETNHYEDGLMYWVLYDPGIKGEDFDYIYESHSLAEAISKVALMYMEKHK